MLKYRSDIDGLRALAVIPVILFHFDIAGFHGGFIGVDVFFVISGYLITALIYKEISNGSFSFLDFYERRARRLLPAAFLVIFCSCIAGWFLFTPEDFKQFGRALRAVSLVVSNVFFMQEAGYFDLPAQVKPLLHTWSLAVEEQFYIIFPPLLLFIMWKFRKHISVFLIALFLVSFGISVATVEYFPAFAFYMLPSRAWELLLGAMLAVGMFPIIHSKVLNDILGISGIAMIVMAIVLFNEKIPFPGVAALLPCLGAVFIIWSSMSNKSWTGAVLSWQPFIFIGLISYSLYLWHWPIRVFSQYYAGRELYASEKGMLIALTFLLSYLTWKFVEQPVRKKKVFLMSRQVFKYTIVGGATFLIFGGVIERLKGVPIRLPEPARTYAYGAWDTNPDTKSCHYKSANDILQKKLCVLGRNDGKIPDYILWGDSHADMLMPVLKKLSHEKGLIGWVASQPSCEPIIRLSAQGKTKACDEFNKAMMALIKESNIKNVILSGFWWKYVKELKNTDKLESYQRDIKQTFSLMSNSKVWIFTDVPIPDVSIPTALTRAVMSGQSIEKIGVLRTVHEQRTQLIRGLFKGAIGQRVVFIEPTGVFCKDLEYCLVAKDGRALYRDDDHLSSFGSLYAKPIFEPVFDAIQKERKG